MDLFQVYRDECHLCEKVQYKAIKGFSLYNE